MTPALQPGTRIGRLRVRADGPDREWCASRCASVLPSLDVEPAGMPRQAILCVKSLEDPLPGGIDARSRHVQVRPLAWESAVRASLRETLGRAARPTDGSVPPNADAVLFADTSELLACAARDACRGGLSSWWWRYLMPGASYERVLELWHRAPEYVPAAFESLVTAGAAMEFARRFSRGGATALLDTVLRAFALGSLADRIASVWSTAVSPVVQRQTSPGAAPSAAVDSHSVRPTHLTLQAPPWQGIVPAGWDRTDLIVESQTFASLCLVLRRAPALPRREAFASGVVGYLRELTHASGERSDRSATPSTVSRVVVMSGQDASAHHAEDRVRSVHADEKLTTVPPAGSVPPFSNDRVRGMDQLQASTHTASAPMLGSRHLTPETDAVPEAAGSAASGPGESSEAAVLSVGSHTDVESAFAGAFFLLNVAFDLELYSHGVIVHDDIDLGVWDFVNLAARDILGDEGPDDPLWTLLLSLAEPVASCQLAVASLQLPIGSYQLPVERDELLARVRDRLGNLLAVDDPGAFLIKRRGTIIRTPGHLDIHFSLERHPIEIRIARLDRNPGWIPATGLYVAFHFD